MGTTFLEIYARSIAEIDDPSLTREYARSTLGFYQVLYTFLNNAIPLYNNPSSMTTKLADAVLPSGATETFVGSGSTTYSMSTVPLTGSLFEYRVSGSLVSGSYASGSAIFTNPVPSGSSATCEWYYPGTFNQTLSSQESIILALFLIACWSEKETNYLLDIRRLLGDTDFSLPSEANSIRAKQQWFTGKRERAEKMMQYNAWTAVSLNTTTRVS